MMKKKILFLGDARRALHAFPPDARRQAAYQLDRVQNRLEPADWKPLPTVAPRVREIEIRERSGALRVIYQAALKDVVLVLNVLQKSRKVPQHEIEKARKRLSEYLKGRALG